jgi:DNA-directed RNA polymerase II subunit RPB3
MPKLANLNEADGVLSFTLSDVNVSVANSLRRIIMSEIPAVVIHTFPDEENELNITINTTRLTNEQIKQRVGEIPIYIKDQSIDLADYQIELDVANTSDNIIYATTEHLKIKKLSSDKYLDDAELRKVFPADKMTGGFIPIVRLRPKINSETKGEHIKFTAKMSIRTGKDSGMYVSACKIAYGFTPDKLCQVEEWTKTEKELVKTLKPEEVELEKQNWMASQGKRIILNDSFDFVVESVGVYDNVELVKKACDILNSKLAAVVASVDSSELKIQEAKTTMQHCFDILYNGEDYTLSNVIDSVLYSDYYHANNKLSYIATKKLHPHNDYIVMRLAVKHDAAIREDQYVGIARNYIKEACVKAMQIVNQVVDLF